MQVDFKILADGNDVTALLKDRLISLTIVDEAGIKSDTAEIVIDDRGYRVELPKVGALLEISLGFKETGLITLGTYTVDEISGEGPVDKMTIKAKAADMLSGIRAPKTRNWDNVTLESIVGTIASEHGLTPAASDGLKAHFYKYLAQTSESDLNLLTRLAHDLDATAKPAGGALVFVKRADGKTANGEDIPVIELGRELLDRWTWKTTGRGKFKTVIAEWSELGAATIHSVTVGDGEPVLKLRHRYATEAEASRVAQGALSRSVRASGKLSVSLGGFAGSLFAEAPVDMQGIKPELSGAWIVSRVEHKLQQTLTTKFDAERDNEEAQA